MPVNPKDIKRALDRVRSAMPPSRKIEAPYRDIRLGLQRMNRIVPKVQSWQGVHVAGTNGKGSICALLAAMMRRSGISYGVFLSPALPEPHNGILINGRYVHPESYETECENTRASYKRAATAWRFVQGEDPGELSPFEIETAAAFRLFETMHIKYGIVEVGMGGATDATNSMAQKSITIISRIDLDHQEYLGKTIEEITRVKAGIMRRGVPCVVDYSNSERVLGILDDHARKIGTYIQLSSRAIPLLRNIREKMSILEEYELQNFLCAVLAFRTLFPNLPLGPVESLSGRASLPGRTERLDVSAFTQGARTDPILADGAHNMLGIKCLAKYVERNIRKDDQPVTWILSFSSSETKPFMEMIQALVKPQDNIAFIEYYPQPNDPAPTPAEFGRDVAEVLVNERSQLYEDEPYLGPALEWACKVADKGPIVVAGSLYLVRELWRLEGVKSNRKIGTRPAGPHQLFKLSELAQSKQLSPEEEREFKRARRHWYASVGNPHSKRLRNRVMTPEMRQAQATAAFHKRQADTYLSAIEGIKRDIEAFGSAKSAERDGENSQDKKSHDLSSQMQEFQKIYDEHMAKYEDAMAKIRRFDVDTTKPHKIIYPAIFGEPQKHKPQYGAVLSKYRLDLEENAHRQRPLVAMKDLPQEQDYRVDEEEELDPEDMGAAEAAWSFGEGRNMSPTHLTSVRDKIRREKGKDSVYEGRFDEVLEGKRYGRPFQKSEK